MTCKIIISLTFFLTLTVVSCSDSDNGQWSDKPNSNNVFTKIDYDKVVAYSYDGEGGIEIIDDKGRLAKKIKKQAQLSKSQTARLTNVLCNKSTYAGMLQRALTHILDLYFIKKKNLKLM
jgi:hypothetical protein